MNIHRNSGDKNELRHLSFDDILVIAKASIWQTMLGNRYTVCICFFSKNPTFFTSARPPAPIFRANLTQTKQLIDCGLASYY